MSDHVTDVLTTPLVGPYVLDAELGRGAYGSVFRGHHRERPNETKAIKIIEQIGSLDRLLLEPSLLSQLQHPNIVGLSDYFLHAGKVVLVMEFVGRGLDLQECLKRRGRLTPDEVREFLRQMADALAYSHAQHILHGDLKPSNILVDESGSQPRYVIADFGVSRIVGRIQTARHISGTFSYMAPEQLRGRASIQSDLWALGAIAYLLLTGCHPFEASTVDELTKRITLQELTPIGPQAIREDFALEQLVYHLLEKTLVSRMSSASALLGSLRGSHVSSSTDMQTNARHETSEKSQKSIIRRYWRLFLLFGFLSIVPDGILGGLIQIGGSVLWFFGQERRSLWRTAAGLFCMIIAFVVAGLIGNVITAWDFPLITFLATGLTLDTLKATMTLSNLLSWPLMYYAAKYFVRVQRAQRDQVLLAAAVRADQNRDEWRSFLVQSLRVRHGDLNLHQRYTEALLNDGLAEDAIVEAKLMLTVDPYSFEATLLLAHAYYETGLLEECRATCHGYLSVAGHCFEFSELAARCQARMMVSTI